MRRLITKVSGKFKGAANRFHLKRALRSRPRANLVFADLSRRTRATTEGSVLCEALWDHAHHWLRLAMFRPALADVYGSGLVGLSPQESNGYYSIEQLRASLRSLPLTAEEVLPTSATSSYLHRAAQLLSDVHSPHQLVDLELPRGFPGYCFYDGVLKTQRLATVDCQDPNLPQYLGLTLRYLDFYEDLFGRHDIRAVVVSHPTHFRFATLVWVTLRRRIPVFVINYANKHVTIRKLSDPQDLMMPVDSPTVRQRDSLTPGMRRRMATIGSSYLERVRQGKAGQVVVAGVYSGDSERYRDKQVLQELAGCDVSKPNAVVMTNCWPDYPHTFGRSYYTDFRDWFDMTLNVIKDVKDCNWVLKPHPAESFYGKKASLKNIVRGGLPQGVYLWPEHISGNAMETFADYIITCHGTAAIEYTSLGKTVLVASKAPYSSWGFCHQTYDADQYVDALRHITQLVPPTSRQQEDANIYAALTLANLSEGTEDGVTYPWGVLSYRLWPGLPEFVRRNMDGIVKEMQMMRCWLDSDVHSYNVFKGLYPELWGQTGDG